MLIFSEFYTGNIHYKKVYFFVILLEGDGESMVFFRSRPLLLNSALSATNWRSGEPSRQSLAKCIFSDSLSPMLLKNTIDSPVLFQTKQNAPGRNVCWTLITIIFIFRNWYYLCKSTTSISPSRILWFLGNRTGKFLSFYSEALGKVSPKIRRLRRLWREGFPERQFSRS